MEIKSSHPLPQSSIQSQSQSQSQKKGKKETKKNLNRAPILKAHSPHLRPTTYDLRPTTHVLPPGGPIAPPMREATRSQGRQRSTKTSKPTSASPTSNPSSTLAFQLNAACERLFRRHGRYISRHQIRILLLCSLVITSLFYPAVGIYFWSSKGGPGVTRGDAASVWRSLSTPFMDSFVSSGRKHHNSLRDLRMVWDDAKDLRAIDARDANAMFASGASSTPHPLFPFGGIPSLSSAKGESPPRCRTIRVEHVFVTTDDVLTGNGPRYGVLDTPVLHSALQLQGTIESLAGHTPNAEDFASADKPRCVTSGSAESTQSGGCLTLSPLAYWDLDAQKLLTDEHPAHTLLTSSLNRTAQGVPASITTTLAGRWHLFKKLPRAEHLALTFFLEDNESSNECISSNPADEEMGDGANEAFSPAHVSWLRLLSNVTAGQVSIIPSEHTVPKELLLQVSAYIRVSGSLAQQRRAPRGNDRGPPFQRPWNSI